MKEEKKEKKLWKKDKEIKLIAKKDHTIVQNAERYEIKKGDEINVPKRFLDALKAEKVI